MTETEARTEWMHALRRWEDCECEQCKHYDHKTPCPKWAEVVEAQNAYEALKHQVSA